MRRHPTAPRAHALSVALPRPAGSEAREWLVTFVAVALLFAALLAR